MTKIIPGTQSFSRSIAVLQAISDCSAPPTAADLLADCGLSRPPVLGVLGGLGGNNSKSLLLTKKTGRLATTRLSDHRLDQLHLPS